MHDHISVSNSFYFPKQVLLDDNPDFLDGVSLMLNNKLSYQLLNPAPDYVNKPQCKLVFMQRSYNKYKNKPFRLLVG